MFYANIYLKSLRQVILMFNFTLIFLRRFPFVIQIMIFSGNLYFFTTFSHLLPQNSVECPFEIYRSNITFFFETSTFFLKISSINNSLISAFFFLSLEFYLLQTACFPSISLRKQSKFWKFVPSNLYPASIFKTSLQCFSHIINYYKLFSLFHLFSSFSVNFSSTFFYLSNSSPFFLLSPTMIPSILLLSFGSMHIRQDREKVLKGQK